MHNPIFLYSFVGIAFLLASCGGGGGSDPVVVGSDCIVKNVAKAGAVRDLQVPDEGQGGDASGDGDGDGNGSLGQFFGAVVVVKNKIFQEIGRTVIDDKGEVNVNIGQCQDPVEVTFLGGDGVFYYDEATNRKEPFPTGESLRGRFNNFGKNFSVTPYTEAAVRLMDSTSDGVLVGDGRAHSASVESKQIGNFDTLDRLIDLSRNVVPKAASILDPEVIEFANQRIGEVMTDHVPGIYRPIDSDGSFGILDITAAGAALNEDNSKIPGTLRDDAVGHRGAVVAGLIEAGGSFLVNEPRPAVEVTRQLAADLSDGKLDLQGLDGPLLTRGEAPAYTYESLWRAKAVGTDVAVELAGDQSLREKSSATTIADYKNNISTVYYVPDGVTGSFTTRTTAGQQVKLKSSGVVSVARSIAAGFKTNEWYEDSQSGIAKFVDVPGDFVDVKVGSLGQIAALVQDRKSIRFVRPFSLYKVNGREFSGFAFSDADREKRRQTAAGLLDASVGISSETLRIDAAVAGEHRVVAYATSPVDRTFGSGRKPDVVAVLQGGSLFGADAGAPSAAIQLASPPEGLLGIAYDKFVPPSGDSATGLVNTTMAYPYEGPRRLYGLTRLGQVKTWIETAGVANFNGRLLAVPGKVVLLAAESVSNVYALNSDGQVFWLNADQALSQNAGSTLTVTNREPSSLARRYGLNSVVPVDLGGRKACWIGRAEAIICGTGEVFRWKEDFAQVDYRRTGEQFASKVIAPVGIGSAVPVNGTGSTGAAIWRFSGVDSQFAINNGESVFTEGMSYLGVGGATTDFETISGLRNLSLPTLRFDDPDRQPGPDFRRGLNGSQFQRALTTAFSSNGQQFSRRSSFSTDGIEHDLDFTIRDLGNDRFSLRVSVDSGRNQQQWPNIDVRLKLSRTSSGAFSGVRASNLLGGDATYLLAGFTPLFDPTDSGPGQLSNFPAEQGPRVAQIENELPLDRGLNFWQAFYRDSVGSSAILDSAFNRASVKFLLVSGIDSYRFRVCFAPELQVKSGPSRFGGLICTSHANDGSYEGATVLLSRQDFDLSGNPIGSVKSIDFGHYYATPLL